MSKFTSDSHPKGGRTPGSRNKLVNAFVDKLFREFEEHGESVIRICRIEDPMQFLKLIGQLVPKEVLLEASAFSGMSDEEIAETLLTIRKLKQSVVSATEQAEHKGSLN
jgi:hypothetical protein